MLNVELKNAVIPNHFLENYQEFFKVYLFKTENATTLETQSHIKLQHLAFSDKEAGNVFGWMGDSPKWLLGDESPSLYEGQHLSFLLQVRKDQVFDVLDSAPSQKEVNIFGGEKDRKERNYFFFNENEVFFFGTDSKLPDNAVYIVTQCD